ncbi:MAG TPA: 2'-5' RNA ligase family protein [Gaiellaceae bacterium]|nr:2'-5' RNA ligase family protein [Gaiellaceae bacterium]
MPSPGSVAGSERLRLFLALRLPDDWLDAIVAWQKRVFAGRDVRVVPREHLHVTLVFLGSTPAGELPGIVERLERAARAVELRPAGYRETRGAAMLTFEDVGGHGAALADALGRAEPRPWLPHVTVARYRERPKLREEFPATLRTHVLVPSDAAAYLSRLRPTGAEYEILASAPLKGHF